MPTLYAATGDAVARVTQDGDAWRVALSLRGMAAQCLAVDPHDPAIVYAGTRGNGAWKSCDGGESWENLASPQPNVLSIAVSAADGAVYAGSEPSHLLVSHDGGTSWRELTALLDLPSAPDWSFPPRPWMSHVRWIAPSPHEAGLLLVGIELGGLMRSADGGESWEDHRPGAQRDVHALAWHPTASGRAYEAGGGGAAWSRDGGERWEPADAGRDRNYCWGLAVDPGDPDLWYVSAAPGPREAHDEGRSAQAVIYRWRGDGPWEPLSEGLPQPLESFPTALSAGPGRLFAALDNGQIYARRSDGDSWERLHLGGDAIPHIEALEMGSAEA